MLILCCGPDTYRATQRARELEAAFRSKHDPSGSSVERLASGKRVVDEVIEHSLAVSLFSPMRFIRADGLIEQCPKQKVKALVHALGKDPERVIVVSIETEKPTNATLKSFADVPKLLVSDYPLLSGSAFSEWVRQAGSALGITNVSTLNALADACDGDAWLASNELLKLAVGGVSEVVREREVGSYELADSVLSGDGSRYQRIAHNGASDRAAYPLFQQALSAIRVHDGDTQGVPPFVISKLNHVDRSRAVTVAGASTLITILSRSGLADTDELFTLFP
jgi:DNA polymerase III delta subunit